MNDISLECKTRYRHYDCEIAIGLERLEGISYVRNKKTNHLYVHLYFFFKLKCPMGRRTGCDFYWLGGHFEMPEFPETGQLSKFFGKIDHRLSILSC